MRIKSVTLENIRSHANSRIEFKRGFNCLVGGLGTGKSSILYAIDFALFGDPLTRSYSYLLREGESAGKVAVEFLMNGKTYRAERGLKKRGKGISQDVESLNFYEEDKLLASMRNEAVEEQLRTITGLNKEIFREVVWVRQEHLKELLDAAPRQRQTRLDQLFGLSDYEAAWNSMREVEKEYEVEKEVYEKDYDVLGIEKLEADYHEAIRAFSSVENEIAGLVQKLRETEGTLQTASTQLDNLEELRKQTEELLKKEAETQTNLGNTEDNCSRLVNEIRKNEKIVNEFEQRLGALEAQVEAQRGELNKIGFSADLDVEELRRQLRSFDDQMTSIKAEQEATRKENQVSGTRASRLSTESKCPLCLQPLTDDYKTQMLKHIEEANAERARRLTELQRNVKELEKLRNTANKAVSDLQSYIPQLQVTKDRIAEENESKNRMEKEFKEQQSRDKTLRTQLETVRKEIAKFNMSELEDARKLHENALNQYHAANAKLESSESRKKDASLRVEDFRERLERAQQKMDRVEKIGRLLETVNGIRDAYRSIQPKLRTEFIKILERVVQQVLDSLVGEEGTALYAHIDETYTPSIRSTEGYEREVSYLSGGERTLLAFAYRFALGQLIMQARAGHGLQMLLLDEPTESLGREDHSVDRLAEAIARLKAEHVIRLEKEATVSKVFAEK
jgi:exonuclease SbcC